MTLYEITINMVISLIGGIIAALAFQFFIDYRKKHLFSRSLTPLLKNKQFVWYYKNDNSKTPKYIVDYSFQSNLIEFKGKTLIKGVGIHGKIILNEKNSNYGEGYYKNDDNIGFGFIVMQVDKEEDRMLVHVHFVTTDKPVESRTINYIAYVCEPLEKYNMENNIELPNY